MSKWGNEEKETLEEIDNIGLFGNILNLAAGDGRFTNKLLEKADKVTAIDINKEELNILKDNCNKDLINKLNMELVDITQKLPFQDMSFDGVFCTGTLHLFDKDTLFKILNEVKRILKSKGKILFDFATDIKRIDKYGNQIIFDGEGNYKKEESILMFKKYLSDFSLIIKESTFIEENLDENAGYKSIEGNFLIISGFLNK